ncbi:MAG TPA: NAD-dependent epimerase/dehydratase family protein [Candidatus Dormibacteraeota bacterium]
MHAVTGPFSYTGKYIARALERRGLEVRGLVRGRELQFQDPAQLARNLDGAEVLYNTYWIRFERGGSTFEQAVANTGVLARAAAAAGVRRLVHISVSNPSHNSPFAYFRGKAAAEEAIAAAGIPYSVVRPTLVFGREDVLVNNMAWLLRRLPAFPVFGDGSYRVQPVWVADVADLAVAEGAQSGDRVIDAAGPVNQSFLEFLVELRRAVASRARLVKMPPGVALALSRPLALALRDVPITREEIGALMASLLVSHAKALAPTSFAEWLEAERPALGSMYTSELRRHWAGWAER